MSLVVVGVVVIAVVGIGIWVGNRIADTSGAAAQALKSSILGGPKNEAPSLRVVTNASMSAIRQAIERALDVKDDAGLNNSIYRLKDAEAAYVYAYGNVMDALFTIELKVSQHGQSSTVSLEMDCWTVDSKGTIYYLAEMHDIVGRVTAAVRAVDPNVQSIRRP